MGKLLLMAGLLLGVMACSSEENSQQKERGFKSAELSIEQVVQSSLQPMDPLATSQLIIDNSTDWQELQAKVKLAEVPIDFDRYTVIAVFDQSRTDLGCTIDIIAVTEWEDHLNVKVDRLNKVGIALMPSVPFHIVAIPKTDKNIVFTLLE